MALAIEKGWFVVQPFTVLAADGLTALAAADYTVQATDVVSQDPLSVRVSLLADNRSIQLDAIGNANSGSNVSLTTRVGGVVHNSSELVTVTAPIDRSGPVFGQPSAPQRLP